MCINLYMARKKSKARRAPKTTNQLPEIFAFGVIVFVIIMLFSIVALATSVNP